MGYTREDLIDLRASFRVCVTALGRAHLPIRRVLSLRSWFAVETATQFRISSSRRSLSPRTTVSLHHRKNREWTRTVRITVLSPHRDDAAFSIGLGIATWLEAGHQVEVVNCFTESEYGPFCGRSAQQADRRAQVTAMRRQEDVCWIRSYSHPVELIDLKLTDAPERLPCRVDEVCMRTVDSKDEALLAIREALEDRAPQSLLLPLGIGRHVDHLTARTAAQNGWPSSLPMAFYEDLPYAARAGAAADIEPMAKNVGDALQPAFAGAMTDSTTAKQRKCRLALCYKSQIDSEVTQQIAGFCERYAGRERLWVNRAWMDAGLGIPN
jgi:LmbE family N-acetylglucosaminyl deacetylase